MIYFSNHVEQKLLRSERMDILHVQRGKHFKGLKGIHCTYIYINVYDAGKSKIFQMIATNQMCTSNAIEHHE